jgi:DNA-binding winged helix-turn-helix (wHTH) protein
MFQGLQVRIETVLGRHPQRLVDQVRPQLMDIGKVCRFVEQVPGHGFQLRRPVLAVGDQPGVGGHGQLLLGAERVPEQDQRIDAEQRRRQEWQVEVRVATAHAGWHSA